VRAVAFNCCRILRVALAKSVTSEAIAKLASLEQLQEFLYCHEPSRNQELYRMCLQELPRLQISCARFRIENADDIVHTECSRKSLQQLQGRLPARLGLRQLALHDACAMPWAWPFQTSPNCV
jgi:hypothetical protein